MSKKEETKFKEAIVQKLNALGFFEKTQQVSKAGTPDFLGCVNSVFVALELKTDDGELSTLQKVKLAKIKKNGGIALAVTPANFHSVYALLLTLFESSQVKKSRAYLLKLLRYHGL